MKPLRPELEPRPPRLVSRPLHRGYPVPWFVEWILDGQPAPIGTGEPDFRVMSHQRFELALRESRCWVCGQKMGRPRAFVIGPMCAVNRTSAEPPSHVDCAEWSARNCPFLARPNAKRREAGMPQELAEVPGIMLARNPGVALVWMVRLGTYKTYRPPNGGLLFDIGAPERVSWWAHGRPATRQEVMESIQSGLPALSDLAREEGEAAETALAGYVTRALRLVPA